MEDRRKLIGNRVRTARVIAKYSQRKFADLLGVDTSSVSHVENGSERIALGGTIFTRIEGQFGWTHGSISHYLETGDDSVLPPAGADARAVISENARQEVERRLAAIKQRYPDEYDLAMRIARELNDSQIKQVVTDE